MSTGNLRLTLHLGMLPTDSLARRPSETRSRGYISERKWLRRRAESGDKTVDDQRKEHGYADHRPNLERQVDSGGGRVVVCAVCAAIKAPEIAVPKELPTVRKTWLKLTELPSSSLATLRAISAGIAA